MLGKFEELVLLALVRIGPKAAPARVYEFLADEIGQSIAFGATYTTLERLAAKKYVSIERVPPRGGRGRERKVYSIEAQGQAALDRSLNATRNVAGSYIPKPA